VAHARDELADLGTASSGSTRSSQVWRQVMRMPSVASLASSTPRRPSWRSLGDTGGTRAARCAPRPGGRRQRRRADHARRDRVALGGPPRQRGVGGAGSARTPQLLARRLAGHADLEHHRAAIQIGGGGR
jgi:hypothetical protein